LRLFSASTKGIQTQITPVPPEIPYPRLLPSTVPGLVLHLLPAYSTMTGYRCPLSNPMADRVRGTRRSHDNFR
jgi:hypothetical protein